MAEIASGSDQQSQGIDQITTAVQQMNEMTQQNAANAEESAGSAMELDNLSHKMQKMVDAFQLGDQQGNLEVMRPEISKIAKNTKSKLNAKAKSQSNNRDWKPNGRDLIPFNSDLDVLKDF